MTMLRSVHDYPDEEALRQALKTPLENSDGALEKDETPSNRVSDELDPRLEWVVEGYDPDDSQPQMLEQELRRLAVLKSYRISESGRNKECERLLSLICRLVNAPMALVSVMDFGFQYLIATRGLKDWREVPRKACICAHALISKSDLLIVPDLSKDNRFKSFDSVTGFPYLRFYAAIPITAPEGFRLGTICVLDSQPRPEGLSLEEKQNLREIADMVMDAMVEHRDRVNHELRNPSQVVACTANDLLTPLKGVLNGLASIQNDTKLLESLTKQQREVITTAINCTSVMDKVCKKSLKMFERGHPFVIADTSEEDTDDESTRVLVVKNFVKHLQIVMEPFPKQVPLVITVDSAVPPVLVADSLKLFHSAVNFLTNACRHTERGSVHLRIYVEQGDEASSTTQKLVFSVEDSGPGISVDQYQYLFKPNAQPKEGEEMALTRKGLGLYSVATEIGSIGGSYGFQPREFADNGLRSLDVSGHPSRGSRFWFSVPLIIPEDDDRNSHSDQQDDPDMITSHKAVLNEVHQVVSPQEEGQPDDTVASSSSSLSGKGRRRRALIIEDSVICRKTLAKQLTKLGFETYQAADGMEGLKAMQDTLFDVVFCDFLMPVLDGIDCVEQYRYFEVRARPWFDQFIVGTSAHASDNSIEKALKVGMNDYRPKPLTINTLSELLESPDFENVSSRLDAIENEIETSHQPQALSSSPSAIMNEPARPIYCLISEESNTLSSIADKEASKRPMKVVRVHDNETALKLLKMRNWDVVFLDDDMADLISSKCVSAFREWEKKNRVKRQKNIVQISSSMIPKLHDSSSVQLPTGFDAAMGKPITAEVLAHFLDEVSRGNSVTCSSSDIL